MTRFDSLARRTGATALLTATALALAQAPAPVVPAPAPTRLGVFFWHDSPNDALAYDGIRNGLVTAGISCEFVERSANDDIHKGAAALAQLRAADCALVFALGTQAALMATRTVRDVPIVFVAVADPVASGIVADPKGSHGNVAGASYALPAATVLHVFQLGLPGLERLGMLRSLPSGLVSRAELDAMRAHLADATAPPIQLVEAVAADADDIPRAVEALRQASVQAIWIPNDLTIYQHLDGVRRGLGDSRLPLVATALTAARTDAVIGATIDFAMHGRRAAALALQILRGAAPGTLPLDTMQSYRVIANLDAARRCGCELPLSALAVADELIAPLPRTATHADHR